MAALLLLDLDNTLADREGAFLAWAQARAREWAPSDPDAVAYFVEQDADGMRARCVLRRARRALRGAAFDRVAHRRLPRGAAGGARTCPDGRHPAIVRAALSAPGEN